MLTPAQIEERRSYIGGSDAPIIAGVSRFMCARELYHRKIPAGDGEPGADYQPEDAGDDTLALVGDYAEPLLDRLYSRDHGVRLRRLHQVRRHPDLPWMAANPDRLIQGQHKGVEFKWRLSPDGWGEPGSDDVPDEVILQCQHYMAVMGPDWDTWDVKAWLPGPKFPVYTVPRDETLIDQLIGLESEFWDRVQREDPPDWDPSHPKTLDFVLDYHSPAHMNGADLFVPSGDPIVGWRDELDAARAAKKAADERIRIARGHLESAMGDYPRMVFPDGSRMVRHVVHKGEHTVEASSYTFLQSKPAPEVIR